MKRPAGSSTEELVRLARPFKIIAFDWDGTAVMGRQEDASEVNALLDRLLADGVLVVVITGTNLTNTTNQLQAVIRGHHRHGLYIATNRGSEVHGFDGVPQPLPLWRRRATEEEEQLLTRAADLLRDRLAERGLQTRVIYDRLNRRKIDLIPLAEWADPPKWAIGKLLDAVLTRLSGAGLVGGLDEVLKLAESIAREIGLPDPRVTSDVKHVEIGLTDKSDSIEWLCGELCRQRGILTEEVLIAGDEFGPIGGVEGSDHKMVTEHSCGAVFVSVGPEPGGAPMPVIHLGGGPERFRELLAEQIDLRKRWEEVAVSPDEPGLAAVRNTDPQWLLVRDGIDFARERELESLMAIANGYVGTRASLAEGHSLHSSPATFLAGVYDTLNKPGAVPELAVAPDCTRLTLRVGNRELRIAPESFVEHRRSLDMMQGIFWREWRHKDPDGRITLIRGFRLASQDDRHLLFQSLTLTPENWSGHATVEAIIEPPSHSATGVQIARPELLPAFDLAARASEEPAVLSLRTASTGISVAMAISYRLRGPSGPVDAAQVERSSARIAKRWELDLVIGQTCRLDRFVALQTSRDGPNPIEEATARAKRASSRRGRAVVEAHASAWKRRWEACDIEIEGDEEAQRALRFAAYNLNSAANPEDERVSIGARTLSGESYKGHVFWDTENFILPFFNFTFPAAARAMLMYRWHTLGAAREKARSMGYRGALFAWESADTGEETTPRFLMAPDGEVVRILCGEEEHHISADIAYAVWDYWAATGDDRFLACHGAEILLETARFWASRGRLEEDGHFHIRRVIGPDEYHESVDDDAYTNVMAAWNLERGVEVARLMAERFPEQWGRLHGRLDLTEEELLGWAALAGKVWVAQDPQTGLIEQFAGYHQLEEYDLGPLRRRGRRGAPMDTMLGRDRIARVKVIKQADVVMLLHTLWDRFDPRARAANFAYYEPRTSHGSSLSPATHALVAARLGQRGIAEEYFIQAARIDLANNMGNASGGVHAAALGGLWQAAILGFAGMSIRADGLFFDPHLPLRWQSLRFPVEYRGARLRVTVRQVPLTISVKVESGEKARVGLVDGEVRELLAGREYLCSSNDSGWGGWEEQKAET